MVRYDRRTRLLAASLSGLAGFLDATAFLAIGGFFVSFMSGNSTRFGVGLAELSRNAAAAGGLIALFTLGVMAGSFAGHRAGPRRAGAVLDLVTVILVASAVAGSLGHVAPAAALTAIAMGAMNAAFEQDGEVRIGLTYMTGTLVKFGQRATAALLGGDRRGWVPYFFQWFALTAGAVAGAVCYAAIHVGNLWVGAAWCLGARLFAGRPDTGPN